MMPVCYLLMLFVLHSHQVSDDSDVGEHPLECLLSVKNKRLVMVTNTRFTVIASVYYSTVLAAHLCREAVLVQAVLLFVAADTC